MYLDNISQNQGKLLGFINSLHFNRDEAKDILQDTNVTLIKKREDFDDTKQFLPWAFAVARFTWLAHKKKKAIELKNVLYDTHITNILLDKKSSSLKKEINYDIEVERMRLLDLVREQLPNKQRKLLDALLSGQSLQEIAEEWEVRYGTVQTLKFRTIRRIKDIILRIKYQEEHHEKATIQKAKEQIQEAQGGHLESAQGRA